MMRSVIAGAKQRAWRCGKLWTGLSHVAWCFTRKRRRSSPARTPIAGAAVRSFILYSSANSFGPGVRSGGTDSTARRSCRERVRKLCKADVRRFGAGHSRPEATRLSKIWRECSTRTFAAGSTTTVLSINPRCIRRFAGLTCSCFDGHAASSSGSGSGHKPRGNGWRGWSGYRRICLLIGLSCMDRG